MRRRAGRISTVLLLASSVAAAVTAIALAAPAPRPAHRRGSAVHARTCRAAVHRSSRGRRRARSRSRSRCSSSHHGGSRRAGAPAGAPAASALGSAGGTSASTGSANQAPAGSASTPSAPTAGETPQATPPSVVHIQVTAVEYRFTLSRTTVPAGRVVFEFVNAGQDEHNLNVLGAEGPPAGTFANARAGSVSDQAMTLRPGAYTMFCSLPEHEAKGMKATLLVE